MSDQFDGLADPGPALSAGRIPHRYVATAVSTWRTCALCGRGANAAIHKVAPVSYVQGDFGSEARAKEYAELWNASQPWGSAHYEPVLDGGHWRLRVTFGGEQQ